MHEISLMQNLLGVVSRTAQGEGGGPVRLIHLRIGELSGVNTDALQFAFDVLSAGTVAEGGVLEFEIVPLTARCGDCGAEFQPEALVFRCPACSGTGIEIRTGREMEIDYICIDNGSEKDVEREASAGAGEERIS